MARHDHRARPRPSRRTSHRTTFTLLAFGVVGALAVGAGLTALWAPGPATPAAATPQVPHLPIVVAGQTFTVPPEAIRMEVQRRPGPQERIDLVYAWPSLTPPPPRPHATPVEPGAIVEPPERIFVTVAPADGVLDPAERLKSIYPRYLRDDPSPSPAGLTVLGFRDGTPYQGEDLVYDESAPEHFLARCERPAGSLAIATCLAEHPIGDALVTIRFPRALLGDWQKVADGIGRLLAALHHAG